MGELDLSIERLKELYDKHRDPTKDGEVQNGKGSEKKEVDKYAVERLLRSL
jgi:hypothetical protein